MYLTHLSLKDFRKFARLDVDVPQGSIIISGSNAQGKTSLLEAIYLLSTFTSFHAESDRDLINFIQVRSPLAVAHINAELVRAGQPHRLQLRIIQEPNGSGAPRVRKQVLLDGVERKLGELVGFFNAVMFLPHMLQVVDGAPENRRRYLNLSLAQVVPGYSDVLARYQRVLSRRNLLLKQINDRGGDQEQLEYWDEQLVESGAWIIHARIQAIQEIERLARRIHRELTREQESLRFEYQPAYDPLPAPQKQLALSINDPRDRSSLSRERIQAGFAEALRLRRADEVARGVTTLGPHRDELRFLSDGIDLGSFGSRGQVRTTLLTLKLAEVAWMKEKTGFWPVLLLDEVLAELDDERRRDLLGRLSQVEQVLLTTTDLDLFSPQFAAKARQWKIKEGQLSLPMPGGE